MVIQSEDGEGYFVFVDSEQLTLENLTLEGSRNFEGALVVNGGSCHLNNVHLKCDPITRGKFFFDNLTKFGDINFRGIIKIREIIKIRGIVSFLRIIKIILGIIVRPFASCHVNNVTITGDHTASISLENASELIESGVNTYSAKVSFNQLAPAIRRNIGLPKLEEKVDQLEIGTKLASPRVDPTEGAGDIAA